LRFVSLKYEPSVSWLLRVTWNGLLVRWAAIQLVFREVLKGETFREPQKPGRTRHNELTADSQSDCMISTSFQPKQQLLLQPVL
jgi:hypothetical protein